MATTYQCTSCGKQYKTGIFSGWSNENLCRACFRLELKEKRGAPKKNPKTTKQKAVMVVLAAAALSIALKIFQSDRLYWSIIVVVMVSLLFFLEKAVLLFFIKKPVLLLKAFFRIGSAGPENDPDEKPKATPKRSALISLTIIVFAFTSAFFLIGSGQAHWAVIVTGVLSLLFIAASIRIANQWEKAVVLRMGKFIGLKGPGLFFIIPIIDRVDSYIDQRIRVTDFHAKQTLTKDTVPVNVDAVVYWMVWDVEKAVLEVEKYIEAVTYITETGLRDIIGRHELADLLQHRENIAEALQRQLDKHTNPWGITCQTVGIKDIIIPEVLSDAMSKQAQAERERQARIILGTAETEISEKFEEASRRYVSNPIALQLRGMNMLFEGLKEKGSLILVPSAALESMNLGATRGFTSLP